MDLGTNYSFIKVTKINIRSQISNHSRTLHLPNSHFGLPKSSLGLSKWKSELFHTDNKRKFQKDYFLFLFYQSNVWQIPVSFIT